jgi:plasmid stabilization system protein ParE
MIIREELLREHSKEQATKIAEYACASKKNFKELLDCFLDKEYRVAQRAAYSVSIATHKKPLMIQPYIGTLVSQLEREDVHHAVIRNSVRILQDVDIPETYHGAVMNACFNFIETPSTPIAIKAFSLTTLQKLASVYPEIKGELKLIIAEKFDLETPAFKVRARRILNSL